MLTCLLQGVSRWEATMSPEKILLFTSTYPYFSYDKIINETMLRSSIPNSSRQITGLQHRIHCVNCETILFEQRTLQCLHLFFNSYIFYPHSICNTPFNFYIFLSTVPTIQTEFLHGRGKIANNLKDLEKNYFSAEHFGGL